MLTNYYQAFQLREASHGCLVGVQMLSRRRESIVEKTLTVLNLTSFDPGYWASCPQAQESPPTKGYNGK